MIRDQFKHLFLQYCVAKHYIFVANLHEISGLRKSALKENYSWLMMEGVFLGCVILPINTSGESTFNYQQTVIDLPYSEQYFSITTAKALRIFTELLGNRIVNE